MRCAVQKYLEIFIKLHSDYYVNNQIKRMSREWI